MYEFWRFFAGSRVSDQRRQCSLWQKSCMMHVVSEKGRMAGGGC